MREQKTVPLMYFSCRCRLNGKKVLVARADKSSALGLCGDSMMCSNDTQNTRARQEELVLRWLSTANASCAFFRARGAHFAWPGEGDLPEKSFFAPDEGDMPEKSLFEESSNVAILGLAPIDVEHSGTRGIMLTWGVVRIPILRFA